ncbi:cyclic-phosphate processing receiver domain-containing protein [Polaribacter porphyrae]|uniref:Cyclic-phosphate processing Receiver domain-containing protein n=1 Tax=Polaribacter porphyrae TaxID=1137780 RepID=A0A2S7WRT5_9FLAO|nr:cyclic-phosphate processing receiver domain-containing protein [Polaribacter porphyrae]PQJ80313.1 hypothetical protein BTO18_14515 [Polaribacter porphyrae]
MSYKLFLDDIRNVDMIYKNSFRKGFITVRSFNEFKKHIEINGSPSFISFDNDLGIDSKNKLLKDGYDCAKWLVYKSKLDLINLNFKVHSANPVASIQIKSLLNNYIEYLKSNSNYE